MKIILENGTLWIQNCTLATDFKTRFLGYMGRALISAQEAIFFPDCTSVHMWFMRTSLDVVFLKSVENSKQIFEIVSIHPNVPAWKALPLFDFSAQHCLELAPGQVDQAGLRKGGRLCIA